MGLWEATLSEGLRGVTATIIISVNYGAAPIEWFTANSDDDCPNAILVANGDAGFRDTDRVSGQGTGRSRTARCPALFKLARFHILLVNNISGTMPTPCSSAP